MGVNKSLTKSSSFQRATRQIGRISLKLANNVKFRKGFEDILFATGNRTAKMRRYLRQNGFCFPFQIAFNQSRETPKVTISANVIDPAGEPIGTIVGFTFQTQPLSRRRKA